MFRCDLYFIFSCGIGPFLEDIYKSAEEFFIASLVNFSSNKTCTKSRKLKARCNECPTNSCKKKDFEETDEDGEGGWQPPRKCGRRRH